MNASVRTLLFLTLLVGLSWTARAQEGNSLIDHGPYLTAPGETEITVVWSTSSPAHGKVLFGKDGALDRVVEPQEHGLRPVGTLHAVRLTGLEPGQRYSYQVVATPVTALKAYFPESGPAVESPVHRFTTLDSGKPGITFSFLADTQHENVARLDSNLDLVDWEAIDFLVHGGDALDHVRDRDQIFGHFLDPISARLAHATPLVYVRGNHETRGPYARGFYDYVPSATGRYYYAFDAGPVHFIVLDTGEDKSDDHAEYGGLNDFAAYQEEEFAWFREHVRQNARVKEAPFTVLLMHNPAFGHVEEVEKRLALAKEAGVDLALAGHLHRFVRVAPGEQGNSYPILVVDQDQVATVNATADRLQVTVTGPGGEQVDAFTVERAH